MSCTGLFHYVQMYKSKIVKLIRVAAEVVTGTGRVVVDQAMRGGVILPHPREVVGDGPEDR